MTREIKFRAWDRERKKMLNPGIKGDRVDISFYLDGSIGLEDLDTDYIEDFILMQYTGLKDKNGKEIYEGDIMLHFGVNDTLYEVRYGVQHIGHDWHGVGFYTINMREQYNISGGQYVEVIGNIYENPDLLTDHD